MVTDRLRDGVRIAQLLASEVTGDQGRLKSLSVADADTDVEPTFDGALAYRIAQGEEPIVNAYVQPDRLRLEFRIALDAVVKAASNAGLRVRPAGGESPRTLVFLEDGAAVKRVLPALRAVAEANSTG
jgi:hypothetical protein